MSEAKKVISCPFALSALVFCSEGEGEVFGFQFICTALSKIGIVPKNCFSVAYKPSSEQLKALETEFEFGCPFSSVFYFVLQ